MIDTAHGRAGPDRSAACSNRFIKMYIVRIRKGMYSSEKPAFTLYAGSITSGKLAVVTNTRRLHMALGKPLKKAFSRRQESAT